MTRNGTYDGNRETYKNFKNWSSSVAAISNRIEGVGLSGVNSSVTNLTVEAGSNISLDYMDRTRNLTVSDERSVYGVPDPLLDNSPLNYDTEIDKCSFDSLAYTDSSWEGSDSNGTARGIPVTPGGLPASDRSESIFVAGNVTQYGKSRISQFAGYITSEQPANEGEYNDNYVVGVDSLPGFSVNQRALIHEGAWKSNFYRVIKNECYLTTSLDLAPSIEERMKGIAEGSDSEGIFTVLNASRAGKNSSESDIGYERLISDSKITLKKIEGVTTGEGIVWSYFRVSDSLAKEQEIGKLIK